MIRANGSTATPCPIQASLRRSRGLGELRILPVMLAIGALSGCAGGGPSIKHEFTLSPGQSHHPELTRALLVPLNETLDRPVGLDVADERLTKLIVRQLASHGITTEELSQLEYRRAAQIAARKARDTLLSGESGTASQGVEFSDMVPLLLSDFDSDAQLIILPNVVIRSAEYSGGRTVRWDGVRRRERGTTGGMTGSTSAASLYTMIFRSDGTQLFSGYGGLDLVFELNMSKKRYELRDDRLQDEEHLSEGICVSLHPFFGDDVDC